MKNLILIAVFFGMLAMGCTEKKEVESRQGDQAVLQGMWKLRSGVWDNEDGTFLRYPEDSITEGPAYIIYSKKHYMVIAHAPKMDYYRGELVSYSIDGDKLTVSTKLSNFEKHVGMEAVWTFNIENDVLTAVHGNNKEVWERIE